MHIDPPIWRYRVACPCCGQGSLAFYSCPECGHTVVICEESGTVYDNPGQLAHAASRTAEDPECVCPSCGRVPLMQFRPATSEEIAAAGIRPGEYE
ncbi:MAG TPA: hypothetical protein VKC56_03365 [Gallionellaceae bacterium]|nr:hypothetical protein [Gallionellaceae bacterium]